MKKKSGAPSAKKPMPSVLASPIPLGSPNLSSNTPKPKPFGFNLNGFDNASSSKRRRSASEASVLIQKSTSASAIRSPHQKPITTIADLKAVSSSSFNSLKRHLDRSNSEILKEFEASHSRLTKRFKIHTQECERVIGELENEQKKASDWMCESMDTMKASFAEVMADSQASASRICKTSIPELRQSMEKAIQGLRNKFGVPSASA